MSLGVCQVANTRLDLAVTRAAAATAASRGNILALTCIIKAPLTTARAPLRIASVHLFVCLLVRPSVCLFVAKMCTQKRNFLRNLAIQTYTKSNMGFSTNSLLDT